MSRIIELNTDDELNAALEKADSQPILIFKHSNTCPISARAKTEVDAFAAQGYESNPIVYQVIVQQARPVSNKIAEVLNVEHQSPQIILLSKGKVLWHTSHGQITKISINQAVQTL